MSFDDIWHHQSVLPFEATTLEDIGFDGDVLHSTGYTCNCACNTAQHIVGTNNVEGMRHLKCTDGRRSEVVRRRIQERIDEKVRAMKLLDEEAPDLARFVRMCALDIRGALLQLGQRREALSKR